MKRSFLVQPLARVLVCIHCLPAVAGENRHGAIEAFAVAPDGAKLYYEVHGSFGPFVFLGPHIYASDVPGFPPGYSRAYVAAFSDRYRVILSDVTRGVGRTPPEFWTTPSVQAVIDDVLAIADHAGAGQFAWVGYSWGGAVGVQLASRTDRLWAVAIGGWSPVGNLYEATRKLTVAGMSEKNPVLTRKMNEGAFAFYSELLTWNELEGIKRIDCPRLVFVGEKDSSPLPMAATLRSNETALRELGWEIHWIPGAQHMVFLDAGKVTPALRDFLDRSRPHQP